MLSRRLLRIDTVRAIIMNGVVVEDSLPVIYTFRRKLSIADQIPGLLRMMFSTTP